MVEMITNVIIYVLGKLGYAGIFGFMFLEGACIPVPSEVILPFGGFLVNKGELNFIIAVTAGTCGATLGSILMYLMGKYGGRPLVEKYMNTLHLSKSKLEKSDRFFQKYGEKVVFFSQMIPIVRTFISLPTGISRMKFKKFVVYTLLGTVVWAFVLVSAGFVMGKNWAVIRSWFHVFDIIIIIGIIAFICYSFMRHQYKLVKKNA